jgi:glycosyltransferase involved in cell wall biosynthesis
MRYRHLFTDAGAHQLLARNQLAFDFCAKFTAYLFALAQGPTKTRHEGPFVSEIKPPGVGRRDDVNVRFSQRLAPGSVFTVNLHGGIMSPGFQAVNQFRWAAIITLTCCAGGLPRYAGMQDELAKKLRVAWVADIFDEVSGIITDTEEMYELAQARGYFWQPVTTYKKPIHPFHIFDPILPVPTGSFYKGTSMYVPDFLRVVQFFRKNKFNVLVSNTPGVMGMLAMAAAKYLSLPWVDIYHTDIDYYMNDLSGRLVKPFVKNPALFFLKQYQKQADLIFVRTREFYDLMVKKGHDERKLRYYPAGVNARHWNPENADRAALAEHGIDPEMTVVIFVGRITKVKDIEFLLRYFTEEKPEKAVCAVIGGGPEKDMYEKKYAGDRIKFLGVQRGAALQKLYASADLYVLPSASETLGKTVLEAMASGTGVVVSDKGGPKDYVTHGENGLVFKAHDYDSFRDTMNALFTDRAHMKSLGIKGRESISNHTDEKLFESFTRHIAELV